MVYAAASINHSTSLVYSLTPEIGASWKPISAGAIPDSANRSVINALAVDNNQIVYAAIAGYNVETNVYFGNVYSNTAADGAWQLVGGGPTPDGGVANSLTVANNGTVYVGSGGYNVDNPDVYFGNVYANTGTGGAWKQLGGEVLPDGGVTNSITLSNDNTTIYAGSSIGNVYASTLDGKWTAIGGGLMPDNGAINSLAISGTGVIYSATSNGNVYATTATGNWQLIGGGSMPDGWFGNAIASYKNNVYAATQDGNTYVATYNQSPVTQSIVKTERH